jgi:hypothetical protein
MGTFTHSTFMSSEKFTVGPPHTFPDRRNAIVEGEEELIADVLEDCGDIARQF